MELDKRFKKWYHKKMAELNCDILILREIRSDGIPALCYVCDVCLADIARIVNRNICVGDIYWYVSFRADLLDKVIAELKRNCNIKVLDYKPSDLHRDLVYNYF